jgi:hypothetical protein
MARVVLNPKHGQTVELLDGRVTLKFSFVKRRRQSRVIVKINTRPSDIDNSSNRRVNSEP